MIPIPVIVTSLMLTWQLPASASECPAEPEGAGQVATESHRLSYSTDPQPVVVSEHFDVIVVVCRSDGTPHDGDLLVDADMPAHGHGMNYRAMVEKDSAGHFRARGMLFHMPGEWRLLFTVEDDDGRLTLEAPISVE